MGKQPTKQCVTDNNKQIAPCIIVIFGASGDLTARKLIPALYTLYRQGSLPKKFAIVGCARTELTDQQFREKLNDFMQEDNTDLSQWPEFSQKLFYFSAPYDSISAYTNLADYLHDLDSRQSTTGNKIFYLATPPSLYGIIGKMLGNAGLAEENTKNNGWTRLVVEKPFGRDLETAIELDQQLHMSFKEHQLFRIDHYLAKETVQNILLLRFANTIFEPIWNRNHIQYIGIVTAEKLGVEHRAGYYEQAGVIRDMFQNHMMQLLALTSMEAPSTLEADLVRDEKVKIYRALKPINSTNIKENVILGQYDQGVIDGTKAPGYLDEPGVSEKSTTPTFAMIRLFIDNWRWKGVPFYLTSGKRLKSKVSQIVVQFKEVPHSMFKGLMAENIAANRLVIGIHPNEKISLRFEAKGRGSRICLESVNMEFSYPKEAKSFDSYEKVLLDCILGDRMLFWRQDAVELSWEYFAPILTDCDTNFIDEVLYPYQSGGWGPPEAAKWMDLIMSDEE